MPTANSGTEQAAIPPASLAFVGACDFTTAGSTPHRTVPAPPPDPPHDLHASAAARRREPRTSQLPADLPFRCSARDLRVVHLHHRSLCACRADAVRVVHRSVADHLQVISPRTADPPSAVRCPSDGPPPSTSQPAIVLSLMVRRAVAHRRRICPRRSISRQRTHDWSGAGHLSARRTPPAGKWQLGARSPDHAQQVTGPSSAGGRSVTHRSTINSFHSGNMAGERSRGQVVVTEMGWPK